MKFTTICCRLHSQGTLKVPGRMGAKLQHGRGCATPASGAPRPEGKAFWKALLSPVGPATRGEIKESKREWQLQPGLGRAF